MGLFFWAHNRQVEERARATPEKIDLISKRMENGSGNSEKSR